MITPFANTPVPNIFILNIYFRTQQDNNHMFFKKSPLKYIYLFYFVEKQ